MADVEKRTLGDGAAHGKVQRQENTACLVKWMMNRRG